MRLSTRQKTLTLTANIITLIMGLGVTLILCSVISYYQASTYQNYPDNVISIAPEPPLVISWLPLIATIGGLLAIVAIWYIYKSWGMYE